MRILFRSRQLHFRFAIFFPAATFFLIAEIVAVPVWIEAEVFEHLQIFFDWLVQAGTAAVLPFFQMMTGSPRR